MTIENNSAFGKVEDLSDARHEDLLAAVLHWCRASLMPSKLESSKLLFLFLPLWVTAIRLLLSTVRRLFSVEELRL